MTWFVKASLSALEFMCISCLYLKSIRKSACNLLTQFFLRYQHPAKNGVLYRKLPTCVLSLGRLVLLNQDGPGAQPVPQEMIRHCSVLVYLIFFSYTAIDNNVKCDTDIVHNLM